MKVLIHAVGKSSGAERHLAGLRPDSLFASDYVGSVGIYTLMYLGLYFIASSGRRGASDSALEANKAQDFRAAG